MTNRPTVEIKYLPHGEGLPLPSYETAGAAGADLHAAIPNEDPHIILPPGESGMIPTGICMAIPAGYEAQVRPRSGLAAKFGITCLNAPGTIDWDYRGEVKVILINHGKEDFVIERGMRIAQLIIAPVTQATFATVSSLSDTDRGQGGFGSTGQ